jgi:LPS export ABC transporter protein LptC
MTRKNIQPGNRINVWIWLAPIILGASLFSSCENDIEVIHALTNIEEFPAVSGQGTEILYSDSGLLKARLIAKELHKYAHAKKPYIEFPSGLNVYFYNQQEEVSARIQAKYAIYWEEDRLWEARDNVIVENDKNENLHTEQLYWDETKGMIYSNKFSKVINQDGTFYGERGFEANQDFSRWKLIGSRGSVNLKDEE